MRTCYIILNNVLWISLCICFTLLKGLLLKIQHQTHLPIVGYTAPSPSNWSRTLRTLDGLKVKRLQCLSVHPVWEHWMDWKLRVYRILLCKYHNMPESWKCCSRWKKSNFYLLHVRPNGSDSITKPPGMGYSFNI